MKIDLHIHTDSSDGDYPLEVICEMVINTGIKKFSITDHDTIKSVRKLSNDSKLMDRLKSFDIEFVKGIEYSGSINGKRIHILGYDFDIENKELLELAKRLFNARKNKLNLMLKYIKDTADITLSKQSIYELEHYEGAVGKPHLAQKLVEEGYAQNRQEAIKKYLIDFVDITSKASAKEIISTIHSAGGKAVFAHPKEMMNMYKLDYKGIEEILISLVELGLDGIEARHSLHTADDIVVFNQLAKKYNLSTTCGSDYHGPKTKPFVLLGKHIKD